MRSVAALGEATGWQNLPVDSPDFEEAVMRACELALAGDRRIGNKEEKVTDNFRNAGITGAKPYRLLRAPLFARDRVAKRRPGQGC